MAQWKKITLNDVSVTDGGLASAFQVARVAVEILKQFKSKGVEDLRDFVSGRGRRYETGHWRA